MTDKPNLRDDLLKLNGTSASASAGIGDKILAEDERRVRRLRWLTTRCWALFLVCFLLVAYFRCEHPFLGPKAAETIGLLFSAYPWIGPMMIVVTQVLFLLAVVLTFSLYMRSRTLTMHQIQARLAGIEEQLRKIAEKS